MRRMTDSEQLIAILEDLKSKDHALKYAYEFEEETEQDQVQRLSG